MPEPPTPPTTAILTLLAIAADVGFLLMLWFSSTPELVKIIASALLAQVAVAILFFYLGRRYEWNRFAKRDH